MSENFVSSNDKGPVVPFSDDEQVKDEDLIVDEPQLALTNPVEYAARKEKRQQRATQRERERKEMETKLQALEERDAKRERELNELRGYVAGSKASRQAESTGKDEFEQRLDAVYAKQQEAFKAYQAEHIASGKTGLSKDREAHFERVAREIESEKQTIHAERVLASREPRLREQTERDRWYSKYKDVYDNPRAKLYAEAQFRAKQALLPDGQEPTNEMVDEAMNAARAQFKLGPKTAPTATERSRLSGIPSSGTGGGGGENTGGIVMTKDLRRMATSLYSDLPEDKAIKKWVDGPGKELRKQKLL